MVSKKKVIFIHINGYLNPIPRVHLMAETLVEEEYEVTVVCVDKNMNSDKEIINGVEVINIHNKLETKSGNYLNILKILNTIRKEICFTQTRPYFIQIFSPLLIPLAIYLKIKFKCKLIYDCYEYWIGGALSEKKYLSGAIYMLNDILGSLFVDGIVYVYEKNPTRNFINILGNEVFRRNILDSIIYNIPDSKNLPTNNNKYYLKKDIFDSKNYFVIGYLGYIMPFKGYEAAIESMKYLGDEYKLLLIGDAINIDFKKKITALIAKNNLEEKIVITGMLSYSEALNYTQICDVGLLLFEDISWTKYSTPNKLFEYMALGVPIIANDLPNISYFINAYSCGLTVTENNPIEIARLIKSLVEDTYMRNQLGFNAKNTYLNNFTKEIQMKKLYELYSNLR